MSLSRADVLAEVRFLLSQGEHPEHVALAVGRSVAALEKLARRAGDGEIALVMSRALGEQMRARSVVHRELAAHLFIEAVPE